MERVYRIRQGYLYFQETESIGMFNRVTDRDDATEFASIESAISYVQHDLKLNMDSVIIEEERITRTYEPLLIKKCTHCNEYHDFRDMRMALADLDSEVECLCEECYEELDASYGLIACDDNGEVIK